MSYRAPVAELRFLLEHVLDAGRLAETERFADVTPDTFEAVLGEAARLAEDVLAPLRRAGDTDGARLEDGAVRTTPGFAEAYRALADGGWVGIAADPGHGGMGLPLTLATGVGEFFGGANLALSLCPLLTQGQIEALEHHAPAEIKALYLPRLVSGAWTGTMNLTEPQAGSDVGAVRTRAEPRGDGSYAVSGQKIFISWGDHDMAENVCHLVLARLPGGPAGTRGLSAFLVPKFIPDADGRPGQRNAVHAISLEHKMGLHGSPTCVMEYDAARGWLIGEAHQGMAAMFTMMNNARLGVGVEGLSQAEAALQQARAFARERRQGRTPDGAEAGIIGHADVRRMLLTMTATVATARSICLDCALSLDMAAATGEDAWAARAAFLTPIAKAFATDAGCEVSALAMQVCGGMGYIEETGIAQFYRDVRVTAIYEGTNGIQAMDLVGRKLADGGSTAHKLIEAAEETAARGRRRPRRPPRRRGAAPRRDHRLDVRRRAERPLRRRGPLPARLRPDARGAVPPARRAGRRRRGRPPRGAGGLPHPPASAAGGGTLRRRHLRRGPALCRGPRVLMPGDGLRYPWPTPPGPGETIGIAPGVLWARLPLPFRPDHLNAYAARRRRRLERRRHRPRHARRARGLGPRCSAGALAGRPVRRVILTHHHPDHVGLAGWFQATGRRALGDAHRLADGAHADPRRAAPAAARRRWPSGAPPAWTRRSTPSARRRGPSTSPTWWRRCRSGSGAIVQGEEIVAGGRRWRVEIGHGHAPEQATLWGLDARSRADRRPDPARHHPESRGLCHASRTPTRSATGSRPAARLATLAHRRPSGAARAPSAVPRPAGAARRSFISHGEARRWTGSSASSRRRGGRASASTSLYGRTIAAGEYGLALAEAVGHLNRLVRDRARASRRVGPDGAWLLAGATKWGLTPPRRSG